jgi:hypothetical protein
MMAKTALGKRSSAFFAPQPADESGSSRRARRARRRECRREDVLGRELRAHERLVDPVARDGIEHPGGVADDEGAAAREPRLRTSHRQAVSAQVRQLVDADAVVVAKDLEVFA